MAGGATIDTTGGNITSSSGLAYNGSTGSGTFTVQGGHTLNASLNSGLGWSGNTVVTGSGTTFQDALASVETGSLTVNAGATFDMSNLSQSFGGLTGAGTIVNSSPTAVRTFTITGTGNTFSGNIVPATLPIDTAVTINLSGGTQTLSGASTYAGGTSINAGTVLTGARGLGSGPVTVGSGTNLSVSGTTAQNQGLAGMYFNIAANQANFATLPLLQASLATTAAFQIQNTPTLNFGSTGANFPAPYNTGQPVFAAYYSGMINIGAAGTYTFSTASDDGSMLFIDGVPVVTNNFNQGVTTRMGTAALTTGFHNIVVAYNNTGGNYGMTAQISGANNVTMVDLNTTNAAITPDLVLGSLTGSGNTQLTTGNLIVGTDNSNPPAYSGVISGIGGVSKWGAGTQIFSSTNTFTGNTSVSAGTLNLSNSLALQGSTVTTGGTGLVFDQSVGTNAFTLGGLSGSTNLAAE